MTLLLLTFTIGLAVGIFGFWLVQKMLQVPDEFLDSDDDGY